MRVVDGVKVLTYEEWLRLPFVKEIEAEFEDCGTCDGSGEHVCDCGDKHTCCACDGHGKTDDLRNLYTRMLKLELEKLLAWREGLGLKVPV